MQARLQSKRQIESGEALHRLAEAGKKLTKSERLVALAYVRLDRGEFLTTAQLARLFRVSARTIQYDWRQVEEQLCIEAEQLNLIGKLWAGIMSEVAAIERRLQDCSLKTSDWLALQKERREALMTLLDRVAGYRIEEEIRRARALMEKVHGDRNISDAVATG